MVIGDGEHQTLAWDAWDQNQKFATPPILPSIPAPVIKKGTPLVKTKLINLAYGRSGDKGDVSNVGKCFPPPKKRKEN